MGAAARDLAHKVAAALTNEPAAITLHNLSSLAPADAAGIRRVFESELKAAGPPSAEVLLTISEDLAEFILAAEIRPHGERQVLLESWPRSPAPPSASPGAPRVSLQKSPLWEQDQPILDAVQSAGVTLVLDSARVLLIRGGDRQSAPVPARIWPRDLRGRLSLSDPAFTAWLPGVVCRGALQPRLSMECRDSQDPWPLAPGVFAVFSPARNFFAGRVYVSPAGVRDLGPFYSAAPAADSWAIAGPQWGGEVAAIDTPCGPRILATRNGSLAEPDAVQPFTAAGGAPVTAGPALEFSGPVTALWSTGAAATAVSRDLDTGRYAAYTLASACGN